MTTVTELIRMLKEQERRYGDREVVVMVNGCPYYGNCNVESDNDYNEILIEIND